MFFLTLLVEKKERKKKIKAEEEFKGGTVEASLTLASILFSIVRTHFKGYIIYAQRRGWSKWVKSRGKSEHFHEDRGKKPEFGVAPLALTPNS